MGAPVTTVTGVMLLAHFTKMIIVLLIAYSISNSYFSYYGSLDLLHERQAQELKVYNPPMVFY